MAEVPNYVLYEHAVGYVLLRVKQFEDIGLAIPEVQESVADVQRFCSLIKLEAFEPFRNTDAALENCLCIADGQVHQDLLNFLDSNLPKRKKKTITLGVSDSKLAVPISEQLPGIRCFFTGVVPEIMRGVRMHFAHIAKDLPHHSLSKAQLSLGHSFSRGKVKFDVHRVDNMVIQSIALLDQLDKDINLFYMRIREWYSYHFPELYKVITDQYEYIRCACAIMNRKNIDEKIVENLKEILQDDEKVAKVVEAARTSMGMDISELDLMNVERFAVRVRNLVEYRQHLHTYIKERMHSCAPSLCALIGEQVGARLISHAGSLTNLAKYPASTVQILGAEKALFRALKTRSKTPKYGLLFHSSFIGRASLKNKGRISRFLANKCSVASRIDCFSDVPVATFGEHLRQQVEDRLKFLETGQVPKKNVDVMKEAIDEAGAVQAKILKKRKKEAKKIKKAAEEAAAEEPVTKKKRKSEQAEENAEQVVLENGDSNKKKKKRKTLEAEEKVEINEDQSKEVDANEEVPAQGKKKKKKHSKLNTSETGDDSKVEIAANEEEAVVKETVEKQKKKKKKKQSLG